MGGSVPALVAGCSHWAAVGSPGRLSRRTRRVLCAAVCPERPGQFLRTVDGGRTIGQSALENGGGTTSVIQIFTDEAGNLITAVPL